VRIEGSTGLSKEEVEKLKKEAETYAAEDKQKRELAELKNNAETLIYTAEKTLKDSGEKAPPELKTKVEDKIKELKEVKDGSDLAQIKEKIDALSKNLSELGAALYKQTPSSAKATEGKEKPEEKPGEEKKEPPEAHDANFEEK
jgi:molecular chaperone DnaK